MDRAAKHFQWSVARPHTIIGYAPGNLMNLGTTLAVYATLCKHLKLPFVFPGSRAQYNGLTDVTDADLLAEHLLWEVTSLLASNNAFNVVNGDAFRWKHMWKVLATYFGISAPEEHSGSAISLEKTMSGPKVEEAWTEIVKLHNLKPYKLSELTSWWHTDADLGREIECVNDMNKSKEMGWVGFRNSETTFLKLFALLKNEKIIP